MLNYSDCKWSAVKSLNRTCEAFVKSLIGDRPLLWALWDCQWLLFPFSGNLCLLKIIASIGFEKVFRTCSKISDTSQRFKICKNSFFFITTSFLMKMQPNSEKMKLWIKLGKVQFCKNQFWRITSQNTTLLLFDYLLV